MDPTRSSFRAGAFCGGVMAAAAAWEMLALNLRTINFVSGLFLAVTWLAAGILGGAIVGMLGGRAAAAFRRAPEDGAAFLATITVGHLLLPLGAGPIIAGVCLVERPLRRWLLPTRGRLDQFVLLALAFHVADAATPEAATLPPSLPRGVSVTSSTPAPASLSVSITVHPPATFPEVRALHTRLRPLVTQPLGREAALWTGRLPSRTGAGPDVPRRLPGGGGFALVPNRRGSRVLAAIFPRATALSGAFTPVASLQDLARAADVPVLRTPPGAGDPPLFLRILQMDTAPSAALAEQLTEESAWLDVSLSPGGDDQLAMAGKGVATTPASSEATLLDVTPTALHVLGLAVPRECDGRVLLDRLAVPGPGGRAPRYRALFMESARGAPTAAPGEPSDAADSATGAARESTTSK